MKIKALIITIMICSTFSQETKNSKTSFGSYGELHINTENAMNFRRFVLFFDHQLDKTWSIKAEVELEHDDEDVNIPSWAGKEVTGEVQYYNAYLSKHSFQK